MGSESVIIGHQAGYGLATADLTLSVIIGKDAGRYAKGARIVYMGWRAGTFVTGSDNTFIGGFAGYGASSTSAPYGTGIGNTGIGSYSGYNLSSGDYNTFLGQDAGALITTGDNNILIGRGVDASSATTSNETVIGNSSQEGVKFGNLGLLEV